MSNSIYNAFIGKKVDYYLQSFEKVAAKKMPWNWAAFWLGIGWLCYRGMYQYALIFGILILVETAAEILFTAPPSVTNGVSIGIWVAFGLLGNTVYKAHADKQVSLIESMSLTEEERFEMAASRGYPSVAKGFLGFFLFAGIMLGLVFLLPEPDVAAYYGG